MIDRLAASDCPLLRDTAEHTRDSVLALFAKAVDKYQETQQGEFAALADWDDVKRIADELARVRSQLIRKRYLVGFLGTSQAGKSTTFNNVLDVQGSEAPAQAGVGDATTSAITRLYRISSGPHTFSLRFLTSQQYQHRREQLCLKLGITNSANHPNRELREKLEQFRLTGTFMQPVPENGPIGAFQKDMLEDDIPYLSNYLRSFDELGKAWIQDPPRVDEQIRYQDRGKYLNHLQDSEPGDRLRNFLIREAEIGFHNDNLDETVEVIDCPGLGSKRSVDTIMTRDFMEELDGALIFVRAEQPLSEDVVRILQYLKDTQTRKLRVPVWIVVNKLDALTGTQLYEGDQNKQTFFDVVSKMLDKYEIGIGNLCFTSNKIYYRRDKITGKVDRKEAESTLDLRREQGAVVLPSKLTDSPDFTDVFESLVLDGGIARLRKLVRGTIGDVVAERLSSNAWKELTRLHEKLVSIIESERRNRAMNSDERRLARECQQAVDGVLTHLLVRNDVFRPHAKEIFDSLFQCIIAKPDQEDAIRNLRRDRLADYYQLQAEAMDERMNEVLAPSIVEALYAEVADKLQDLPSVRVRAGEHEGDVRDLWNAFGKQDRDDSSWHASSFPRFFSEDFLNVLKNRSPANFDGEAYLTFMRNKLRVSVPQALHAMRMRMRLRLETIQEAYFRLVCDRSKGKR